MKKIYCMRTQGQVLVTLLFFMVISISIISAAVVLIVMNATSLSHTEKGLYAHTIAESGAENAILRLLRDPSYSGEILQVGDGSATISVSGTDPKVIVSSGQSGDHTRSIEVIAGYTNNQLTINSWKEITQ